MARYNHITIKQKKKPDEFVSTMTRVGLHIAAHRRRFTYGFVLLVLATLAAYGFWAQRQQELREANRLLFEAEQAIKIGPAFEDFLSQHQEGRLREVAKMRLAADHIAHQEWDQAAGLLADLEDSLTDAKGLQSFVRYQLAMVRFNQGNHDQARPLLQQIVQTPLNRFSDLAQYQLAVIEALQGSPQEAQRWLDGLASREDLAPEISRGVENLQVWLIYQGP